MAVSNKSNNILTKDLGYLGIEFQNQLLKVLIEDRQFFTKIESILNQNMFSNEYVRRIVGLMKDRFAKTNEPITYTELNLLCKAKIRDEIAVENMIALIKAVQEMPSMGIDIVQTEAERFFKQQNLVKAVNKANDIIKRGNSDEYDKIEGIFSEALQVNIGQDLGQHPFDNFEKDLAEDYRETIPTGTVGLDSALGGGLGRGELGVIVAPMGVGKAQPLTSKVLTPNGFINMGDIKVGDKVIGRDGKSHTVTGVYPQGIRPIYKVSFSNGTSCECDIEHLWTVKLRYNNEWKTLTLKEIIKRGITLEKTKRFKWVVPNNEKIHFNEMATDNICYKTIEERQRFLDGFNWHISKNGVNKRLKVASFEIAENICAVSRSLGYSTSITYEKRINEYSITIKLKNSDIFITNIEYTREDEAQCIMVDSDEHLYITDDFIVTHNTSITSGFVASAATAKTPQNDYQGYKVLHIFFEDKPQSIMRKYYGHITNIDADELSKRKEEVMELCNTKYAEQKEMMRNNVYSVRMSSGEITATAIRSIIKRYISLGFRPDMVVIDYFECLKLERATGDTNSSEWSMEGVTMRKLEALANELDIAIWIPIQGTKDSIGAEYVGLGQAGGSVKKTQIGHVVVTLAQTPDQKEQGRLNMFICKLRAVRMTRCKFQNVAFNNGTCRFDESTFNEEDDVDFGSEETQSIAAQAVAEIMAANKSKKKKK